MFHAQAMVDMRLSDEKENELKAQLSDYSSKVSRLVVFRCST